MNTVRICLVVTGKTLDEFLNNLVAAERESDLVEMRADYISGLKSTDIDIIRQKSTKPSIFTCRKQEEGGKYNGTEKSRLDIIRHAIDLGFDYIDVEYSTLKNLKIDKKNSKLIASFHDFEKTPPYWELTRLVFDMKQTNADIIKIATMVTKEYDLQVLYRILLSKKPSENQIIIGMGQLGKQSRILGPLLGSYLTYAATDTSATAPGQININAMKTIYSLL